MSCSTSTLPHQGVSIFPTPPPSGVPRRGIAAPLSFQTLSLLAGATVRMFGTLTSAPPTA